MGQKYAVSLSLKNLAEERYSSVIMGQKFTYVSSNKSMQLVFQRNKIIFNGRESILINVRDVNDVTLENLSWKDAEKI